MSNTVEALNKELIDAQRAYYAGEPIMSDAEYDVREAQLKTMSVGLGISPSVLTKVGTDTGGRIPHQNPMRSIENVYSEDELMKWYGMLNIGEKVTLETKDDGVSCSLTYERGLLVRALTRGDGDAGESILAQVQAIDAIPKKIAVTIPIEIRGELVMKASTMARLNEAIVASGGKPYVSTRNLVAGTMKLHDLSEVAKREILFYPWEVLCPLLDAAGDGPGNEDADSANARLQDITIYGFPARDAVVVDNQVDLKIALANAIDSLNEPNPEIGRDGIVIKVDRCARRRELGLGSKFARFQVAYKLQNARAESVLRDVIWQVGRQGKLTPVGIIDPVVLAGATIERVTLNNATWIASMGLQLGCRVNVVRSGDVIPQITGVAD